MKNMCTLLIKDVIRSQTALFEVANEVPIGVIKKFNGWVERTSEQKN
jgi:hypothetical protein